ncbi:MAG: putative bifunctional diguanylate cyclase/phosphodiesterase [Phycisphaerales bacterium]
MIGGPLHIENARVLVIDDLDSDHAEFARILGAVETEEHAAAFLERDQDQRLAAGPGYDLDFAAQGDQGVEMVRHAIEEGRPYSIVFCDVGAPPDLNGVSTIEALWKVDRDIQIVLCSDHPDHTWEDVLRRLGVTDRLMFVKRPFDHAELRQIALALCAKWNHERLSSMKLGELERHAERQAGELAHAAMHDELTGLPNRRMIRNLVDACLAQDGGTPFTLLLLDCDRFKRINDSLGHDAGDMVLRELGDRLTAVSSHWQSTTNTKVVCARLGGDEFMILIRGTADEGCITEYCDHLLEAFEEPFEYNGHQLALSTSIGYTSSTRNYTSAGEMMRDADAAMYVAKADGKGQATGFVTSMHDGLMRHLSIESALRGAVERGEFEMHYQPLVDIESGRCVGAEGLIRWRGSDGELIPPDDFIPIAEETGQIVEIGRWAFEQALRDAVIVQSRFPRGEWYLGVNVSLRQLQSPGFVDMIREGLEASGVPGRRINIEVTESMIMEDESAMIPMLQDLKALDLTLSMDDFGTGYSSLTCLQRYPVDVVKLDREFVNNLLVHRRFGAIAQAAIMMVGNMGMRVVAEGVERIEQLVQLQAMDCDAAQGYYFSKPVPIDGLLDFVGQVLPLEMRMGRAG